MRSLEEIKRDNDAAVERWRQENVGTDRERRFDTPNRCAYCGSKGEHLRDCDNPMLHRAVGALSVGTDREWPNPNACCSRNAFEDDAHSPTCPQRAVGAPPPPTFGRLFGKVMKQHPTADAVLVNSILRIVYEDQTTWASQQAAPPLTDEVVYEEDGEQVVIRRRQAAPSLDLDRAHFHEELTTSGSWVRVPCTEQHSEQAAPPLDVERLRRIADTPASRLRAADNEYIGRLINQIEVEGTDGYIEHRSFARFLLALGSAPSRLDNE